MSKEQWIQKHAADMQDHIDDKINDLEYIERRINAGMTVDYIMNDFKELDAEREAK